MTRAELRNRLLQSLGGPWPKACDLNPRLRETMQKDGYRVESLLYDAEPGDAVPAYLLVPDSVDADHPAAAVAVWHQHGGQYDEWTEALVETLNSGLGCRAGEGPRSIRRLSARGTHSVRRSQ